MTEARRPIASLLFAMVFAAATSAELPAVLPKSAMLPGQALFNESGWRYKAKKIVKGDPSHTQYWIGEPNRQDGSMHTEQGAFLGVGSYGDALAFYLTKCGLDPDADPPKKWPIIGKTKVGSYVVNCPPETCPNRHTILLKTNKGVFSVSLRRVETEQFEQTYRIFITTIAFPTSESDNSVNPSD